MSLLTLLLIPKIVCMFVFLPPSLLPFLQHIRNTLNPHWPPFKVESNKLCGGDASRSIRVQCLDWDDALAPDLIGEFYTSLAEMSQAAEEKKVYHVHVYTGI